MMKIALCTDNKYAMPCGTCICSIFENCKGEDLEVIVLTAGLNPSESSKFKSLGAQYHKRISIMTIEDNMFAGLHVSERFPISIYYRFLLPQILKNDSKVLYLDCDIIVNQNLSKLWDYDISNYACAAVENQSSDDIRNQNRIGVYSTYLNSGVLLMNLDCWRTNHIAAKLTDYMACHLDNWYPDQDALNVILQSQVLFLPYTYNFQDLWYGRKDELFLHKDKWEQIDLYRDNPVIIHFCNKVKPWHDESTHPYANKFLAFKKMTPWSDCPITHAFPLKKRIINQLKKIINL